LKTYHKKNYHQKIIEDLLQFYMKAQKKKQNLVTVASVGIAFVHNGYWQRFSAFQYIASFFH